MQGTMGRKTLHTSSSLKEGRAPSVYERIFMCWCSLLLLCFCANYLILLPLTPFFYNWKFLVDSSLSKVIGSMTRLEMLWTLVNATYVSPAALSEGPKSIHTSFSFALYECLLTMKAWVSESIRAISRWIQRNTVWNIITKTWPLQRPPLQRPTPAHRLRVSTTLAFFDR